MRPKLILLTLLGVAALVIAASAQNTPPANDTAGNSSDTTATTPAASDPAPANTAASDPAPASAPEAAPAPATASATPAAPAATEPAKADAATATAATSATAAAPVNAEATAPAVAAPTVAAADPVAGDATSAAAATSPEAPQPGAVIPLIVMDDVPLTDAIRNLARQARLNYMLDPKIAFGQPGPDGKPMPQPVVSIRWENVTAEHALNSLLNNYSLQIVEDPKSKIARVSVKDPAAPDPLVTRIIQLKYSAPTNILSSILPTLTDKRSKAVGDVRTSQLVILATEKELEAVGELVEQLDKQTPQVLIEARLIETSINPKTIKGIDWSGTLQAQHLSLGNNLQDAPVASGESVNRPLSTLWPKMLLDTAKGFNPATAFLDADGVNAVLSFINLNAEAKVLSAPRAVTLDNETAMISVTRASPIINVTPGTANTTGGSQITYTNLGVILNVTPRISANNYVNLKVVPEVSRIFDTVRRNLGVAGVFEADEYDVRKIETRVMIPSGNTLVLGGLVQDDVRESNSKVPVLGDIPGLGYLFRQDSKSRSKANLLIFITPTIVKDEDFQPTKSDFLKAPVPMQDAVEPDWSAWDTGKPKDWSKPRVDNNAGAGNDGAVGVFAPVP